MKQLKKQLKSLGIGLGLILVGMNGTGQAQTIYNSILSTNTSKAQIKEYDMNRRQLEQPPPPAVVYPAPPPVVVAPPPVVYRPGPVVVGGYYVPKSWPLRYYYRWHRW
jgi:hypothetical protein